MFGKILSTEQLRETDRYTIVHEPISSLNLMERASQKCCNYLFELFPDIAKHYHLFCGMGNNGGDGMAIARLLASKFSDNKIDVYLLRYGKEFSPDATKNLERLDGLCNVTIHEVEEGEKFEGCIADDDVVIDAIFGSGLSRPISGWISDIIGCMNANPKAWRIAIDVPSGLFGDCATPVGSAIFEAGITLAFHSLKRSFLFPENSPFVGKIEVLDIGLSEDFVSNLSVSEFLLDASVVEPLKKFRGQFAHKGQFGRALLICGSYGKMGAAVLAAQAALRVGVGVLSVHVPKCGVDILQISVPEAIVSIDDGEHVIEDQKIDELDTYAAVGIGCGLGREYASAKALYALLKDSQKPLILDADALNILSMYSQWYADLPRNTILTPHFKEFDRLMGKVCVNHDERLSLQKDWSVKYGVFIVLKGAFSAISTPSGELYFNPTGNPGMATAGSGDILTGIITSLLAQGYDVLQATLMAVYLHGKAGDKAKEMRGERALIARDIIKALSEPNLI